MGNLAFANDRLHFPIAAIAPKLFKLLVAIEHQGGRQKRRAARDAPGCSPTTKKA